LSTFHERQRRLRGSLTSATSARAAASQRQLQTSTPQLPERPRRRQFSCTLQLFNCACGLSARSTNNTMLAVATFPPFAPKMAFERMLAGK
jgi:hypothetical protein